MVSIRTGFNLIYLHEVEECINRAAENAVSNGYLTTDKDVTLLLYPESDGSLGLRVPLVSQRSTAVQGVFQFYDIIPVVRNYMLEKEKEKVVTYLSFDFRQDMSTVPGGTLDILFMEWRWGSLTAQQFVAQRFLTSSPVSLLLADNDSAMTVPFFFYQVPDLPDAEEAAFPLTLTVRAVSAQMGNPERVQMYSYEEANRMSSGVFQMYRSLSPVFRYYKKNIYTCGGRAQTVYFFSGRSYVSLQFANYFNVQERIDLPAFVTREPATEKNDAVFGDRRQDYDLDHSDTYTIETELLPAEVYDTLLAFVRSRDAQLAVNRTNGLHPVVIDEYEIVRSNRPGDPIRFTCSYRLKDTKRLL